MIGLDTNILVRHIVQDDSALSLRASELIEVRLSQDDPGYISIVVMAELAWVLERAYGLSGEDIASVMERLLQVDVLVVEHEQAVSEAVAALKRGRGSFPDALIAGLAREAGCSHTLTFDRKALRLPGFAPAQSTMDQAESPDR